MSKKLPSVFFTLLALFQGVFVQGIIVPQAYAAEKVVLQLKWEHEFQFAGYYAALWQGYYEREGLDVEIRSLATEQGRLLSPLEEVTSGRADFAIGGTDVFVYKGRGFDIQVLAPVFQRSPGSLFSLQSQPLNSVEQASRLTIAAIPSDDTFLEARAMFFLNGIDAGRVKFVDLPVTVQALQNRQVDAIATYAPSANFRGDELDVRLNHLAPNDHGVQFYGDMLYTRGELARNKPELAEKFRRASLDGWHYALAHRDEIARRIAETLPRHVYQYEDLAAYNQAFARVIDEYTYYPVVELGYLDPKRWQRTYDILERLGEIEQPYDPASLLFSEPLLNIESMSLLVWGMPALLFLLLSAFLLRQGGGNWRRQLGALFVLLLFEQALEAWHRDDTKAKQSILVLERLATVRSKLEQVLARNLAELSGVAAFISANPDLTQQQYAHYVSTVMQFDPQLINLAAAPDLVVKYVYPYEGNEKVIGLDYRKNLEQLPAVMKAVTSNQAVIAGPVNLVQGGQAFIGRVSVRVPTNNGGYRNWGIVSAPIDISAVYKEAGLLDPEINLKIAIRGRDGSGSQGDVFYGDSALFDHPQVVTQTMHYGGGSWQIGALDSSDDNDMLPRLLLIRISAVVVAFLVLLLLQIQVRNRETQKQYQTALRQRSEFLREVEVVAGVGGWRMDSAGVITEMSEQAKNLLQLSQADQVPNLDALAEYFAPDNKDSIRQLRDGVWLAKGVELEAQSRDGERWFRLIGDPVRGSDNQLEMVGAIQDITEKKRADEQIERQANYDSLTNLPNRELFRDRLEVAMARARRLNNAIALLFIDLDNFKAINDNYGHREGDLVLQQAAQRIKSCLRDSDTVGRHSGDEFTVILNDIENDTIADQLASKLIAELAQPFVIRGVDVHCGASIGIAFYPADADNAESLLVNADQAMYEVKNSGRNGWHYYTDEMQLRSENRHRLYNELIAAIRDDSFSVYLQPIIDLRSGKTCKCEALIRWQREDGSWLPPNEFIPLAEETGLINQLDYTVMTKATAALRKINQQRKQPVALSVNVSPRLFQTKDQALDRWLELVRESRSAAPLTIEITERLLTEENERSNEVLQELSELGVGISIDDFGTGYSSLSYLTRFPVTGLKIDRSFVNGIGSNVTSESLIESILAMAAKLNVLVVAEGIETLEQQNYLKALNCEYGQGYFIGRPVSVEAFTERLIREDKQRRGETT